MPRADLLMSPHLMMTIATVMAGSSACVKRTTVPRETVAVTSATAGPGGAEAVVRLAIALDASGDRKADTLYAAEAIVIENSRQRLGAPRFAGITSGAGRVMVTAATENIEGRFAWVLVDYNWINPAERRSEPGRATFICERRGENWKIVHAHSSQPLPWEP